MKILLFLVAFSLLGAEKLDLKKTTSNQKGKNAISFISKMSTAYSNTRRLLKKARKEKDIIKLNCVNENFKKIEGLLKSSKGDRINLDEAISADDTKAINHYYIKIFLANKSVKSAAIAAKTCTGSVVVYADDKPIQLEVKDILVEEKDNKDLHPNVDIDIPTPVSPYF